jgi:hypothetical protein
VKAAVMGRDIVSKYIDARAHFIAAEALKILARQIAKRLALGEKEMDVLLI